MTGRLNSLRDAAMRAQDAMHLIDTCSLALRGLVQILDDDDDEHKGPVGSTADALQIAYCMVSDVHELLRDRSEQAEGERRT